MNLVVSIQMRHIELFKFVSTKVLGNKFPKFDVTRTYSPFRKRFSERA